MQEALKFKELGNQAFQARKFEESVQLFTKAIELNANDHVFYSNRSGAYASLEQYEKALEDAQKCVQLRPDWGKGYQRKGLAEFYLKNYDESIKSYQAGLQIEPNNQQLQDGLKRAQEESGPQGGDFQQQMFMKLLSNPKTAGYMKDPAFVQKLQMIQTNPQMMQIYMQDPQVAEAFQVMFGMDLGGKANPGPGWEDISPQANEHMQEEPEIQSKPYSQSQPKTFSQQKPESDSSAEKEKNLGNAEYKIRNFEKAMIHYNNAINLDKNEVLFYNNKSAVFIELKQYQDALNTVDEALKVYENSSKKDFIKLAKLFARKAAIYKHLGQFKKSIEFYEKSLLEDNQYKVKEEMKVAAKLLKEQEERGKNIKKDYINPELAEKHNDAARDLFKQGDFPQALKQYEEAIKRSPTDAKYQNNKSTCLLKLMDFNAALQAASKALDIDPNFHKALVNKGNAHFGMKEYHKALECFQKGQKFEPDNKQFNDGIQKTQMKLMSSNSETKEEQDERARHAMADPEIQAILQDPNIMNVLRNIQERPNDKEAMRALQDPTIAAKIQKLIQAGVLRTG